MSSFTNVLLSKTINVIIRRVYKDSMIDTKFLKKILVKEIDKRLLN